MSTAHEVTVVDIELEKIRSINEGKAPFKEEGMDILLREAIKNGNLKAVSPEELPEKQALVALCVGTPPTQHGTVDLSHLEAATKNVLEFLPSLIDEYLVIAVRSTAPPGTTRSLVLEPVRKSFSEEQVGVVFNPEFMRQGYAVEDVRNPDRTVIGSADSKSGKTYEDMLKPVLTDKNGQVLHMSLESAELCKYASNTFLATKISFANEMSRIAERLPTVDVDDVMDAVVADSRISPSHLRPGLGFGGTCLPKDLKGLIAFAQKLGVPTSLLEGVKTVNASTSMRLMNILDCEKLDIKGKKVAVLGLTFKAGTDDTRESHSLHLIEELEKSGCDIWAHDPMVNEKSISPRIRAMFKRCHDVTECTKDAYAVFLMTDWPVYAEFGLDRIMANTNGKLFIDARRLFSNSSIPEGIQYRCLGSFVNTEAGE